MGVGRIGGESHRTTGALSFLRTVARAPRWVWLVALALAAIEPLTHVWIAYFPPVGTASTGMHIPDSVIFLHAMNMFENGFFSPYASCEAEHGLNSHTYYPVAFHWMYGIVGSVASIFPLSDFIALGLANGLGALFFLLAVYWFFVEAAPKHANLAFLLFALAGGLGGVLYIATGLLGIHGSPAFEANFFRYAFYDLLEGPRTTPALILPRLYYTLPLGLFFLSLTHVIRSTRTNARTHLAFAVLCLFIGALINFRFGPMVWAIVLCYLYGRPDLPLARRATLAGVLAVPVLASLVVGWWMFQWNPVFSENHLLLIRRAMWFSPFLCVSFFHLFLAPGQIKRDLHALPRFGRACAWAGIGYLATFALLFIGYHLYYGSLLQGADFTASVRISDPALLGALAGIAYAVIRRAPQKENADASERTWLVLWLLAFVAIAISAWGQGWFIRLGPQRLMLFIAPPMCILSAAALQHLAERKPRLARGFITTMIACGVCSVAVASLCFQGPLGVSPGQGAFAWAHGEVMSKADAQCLEAMGEGVVMTPTSLPLFGDIVTLRGNRALYGQGAWDLADQSAVKISSTVDGFFDPTTTPDARRVIAIAWCVEYVYCPDTNPVSEETLNTLRSTPWLTEIAAEGKAVLFKVELVEN